MLFRSVIPFSADRLQQAIKRELAREGQVYYVHNRIKGLEEAADRIRRLVPEARIEIGHGQMPAEELERVMLRFMRHECDVLVSTSIIESGVDNPRANTMFIDLADLYGLADLHQLRGRVGRSGHRAYCYLFLPQDRPVTDDALRRLKAIEDYSMLGAGFRIAMRDLEIRGAGNLLGGEQSGHIDAVGFEMYMKLLEESVRELKGEEIEDDVRAAVNLRVDLKIDDGYIPDMNQRLMVYRKVAASRSEAELTNTLEELHDRYGPPTDSVLNLAEYGRIRIMADRLGVDTIDREGRLVVIKFRPQAKVDGMRLVKVVHEWPGAVLVPPVSLKLDLDAAEKPIQEAPGRVRGTSRAPAGLKSPTGRKETSWWTARATAGEVTSGFTKEEILRRPEMNPRAEGGMFSRLEALLRALQ